MEPDTFGSEIRAKVHTSKIFFAFFYSPQVRRPGRRSAQSVVFFSCEVKWDKRKQSNTRASSQSRLAGLETNACREMLQSPDYPAGQISQSTSLAAVYSLIVLHHSLSIMTNSPLVLQMPLNRGLLQTFSDVQCNFQCHVCKIGVISTENRQTSRAKSVLWVV